MNFICLLAVVGQLIVQGPPKFPLVSSSSTLNTSLVAYWKLDESSAGAGAVTREDSYGSNDLADNNTTASGTGIISNGADFEASNSEYIGISDNADLSLSTDTDFFISSWIRAESLNTTLFLTKRTAINAATEYSLAYIAATGIRFTVGNGTTYQTVDTATISTATWYHLVAWHDSTADTINIRLNDTTTYSAAWSSGTQNSTGVFVIGASSAGAGNWDGLMDEVGFWKGRIPTAAEITELYNSGSGKTCCPF